MKLALNKPDFFGALASTLCLIHCLATPFIFIAQACSINDGCANSPIWWQSLDYLFLAISFIAIYLSTQKSSNKIIAAALWASWTLLVIIILNEKIAFFELPEYYTYASAILLTGLHLYNLKYCQCKTKNCCVKNE
ncbi:MerC domain-containing protein [Algibacter sp. PT7-4]|uniref:MerC domain-containing protein n=1 Tax=Algibacter ulvanivorans TaxID=3400999 RepID=UPI003AAC8AD3